jgi:hypothetical protein
LHFRSLFKHINYNHAGPVGKLFSRSFRSLPAILRQLIIPRSPSLQVNEPGGIATITALNIFTRW